VNERRNEIIAGLGDVVTERTISNLYQDMRKPSLLSEIGYLIDITQLTGADFPDKNPFTC
jgi:hypothetical protein